MAQKTEGNGQKPPVAEEVGFLSDAAARGGPVGMQAP